MIGYTLSALALVGAAAAQVSQNGTLASEIQVAAAKAHFDRMSFHTGPFFERSQ